MFTFLPPVNLYFILADILQVLVILIFVEVIRSFANMFGMRNTSTYTPWVRSLHKVVNPVLNPFRRLWESGLRSMSRTRSTWGYALQRIDLSPLLALIAIQIVQGFLFRLGVQSMGYR